MNNSKDLKILRHSAAHLVAQAVQELFPNTILTIGPATDDGFFYDFLPEKPFKEEDLPIIEAKMLELANKNLPITHKEINKTEALEIFKNNPFKLELINDIPENLVGISQQGNFYDLCRGGHVTSTGLIKFFKLLYVSGSYWRADKNKQALQRIYGTAFYTKSELDTFLKQRADAALYDHRKLGKQLNLFSFHEEGVGFPFFHAKGKTVLTILTNFSRWLQNKHNYQEISTPMLLTDELWKRSGHYTYYKDNMYFCFVDDRNYAIKPMNCPGAFIVYKDKPHSYRELPLRLSEFGLVHRHELSGVLHGLMRVRAFTIDDAHIFCPLDLLEDEIIRTINLTKEVLNKFNFPNIKIALSTKPIKAMGSDELWQKAITALENALHKSNTPFTIQHGEGAFYGPKIEFVIQDSMGREWQCGTIQVDFFQAENFDLSFINNSGNKERPVIIHRAIYGSLERFFAILLEHFKGNLPFWLAPVQIRILTITEEQRAYGQKIMDLLQKEHVRVELDDSSDPISGKIKSTQIEKIPWMIIIGKKEMEENSITIRYLDGKQEFGIAIATLLQRVISEQLTSN